MEDNTISTLSTCMLSLPLFLCYSLSIYTTLYIFNSITSSYSLTHPTPQASRHEGMSDSPLSPSTSQVRGESRLTARGRNRQQDRDSPPLSTTPHYSNNTTANTKKKEKVGKEGNPDVFSIDLMTPMTELQIAYFGEPLNATFPSASCNETCETTKPTRTSTPHAQNRKGAVRTRTSLPDRLQKSLPPIHSSSNSGESSEDSENTGQQIPDNTVPQGRPATTTKTTRGPKLQSGVSKKKVGPVTASEVQLFNRTTLNIAESISSLKTGLQDVDKAIKVDNEVILKHQVSLQQLEIRREGLLSKLREKEEWLQKYL